MWTPSIRKQLALSTRYREGYCYNMETLSQELKMDVYGCNPSNDYICSWCLVAQSGPEDQ